MPDLLVCRMEKSVRKETGLRLVELAALASLLRLDEGEGLFSRMKNFLESRERRETFLLLPVSLVAEWKYPERLEWKNPG